jgi:Transcriptional regulator, AbiEi antitoxin, Type IV TA system
MQYEEHLWGRGTVPAWVVAVPLHERLLFRREHLFDEHARAVGLAPLPTRVRDWTLTASTLERAIMEVLSLVDDSESSFTHAAELFEGLTVLRAAVVNELLAA